MNIDELLGPLDWEDLPEDPDDAFAHVLKIAQRSAAPEFDRLRGHASQSNDFTALYDSQLGYLSSIVGVAKGLGVQAFADYHIPDARDFDEQYYRRFLSDVNHFSAQAAARRAIRSRQLSVRLEPKVADSIRSYVHHLKDAIDQANMSDAKKANLHSKLKAFEQELDGGKRINVLRVSLLVMEIIGIPGSLWATGEVAQRLGHNIIQAIADAKHEEVENRVSLEVEPRLALAAAVHEERSPQASRVLDDDIPF
jgi:hypothetical protein